jgi:hypothetical protein
MTNSRPSHAKFRDGLQEAGVERGDRAPKVVCMKRKNELAWHGFESLHLGDMVHLPGEGPLAVRMLAAYDEDQKQQRLFCVLGDGERILFGAGRGDVIAYVPIDQLPPRLASGKVIAEGRAGYLAAHVPNSSDALDVMPWRVLRLSGHLHPILMLYRGPQLLVFLPVGAVDIAELKTVHLPRSSNGASARRVSALVDLPAAPVEPRITRHKRRSLLGAFFAKD